MYSGANAVQSKPIDVTSKATNEAFFLPIKSDSDPKR